MSSAITIAAGQVGKVIRIRTGYDLSASTARIVRLRRDSEAAVEVAGVPFDPDQPQHLLFTIPATPGVLDEAGTWAVGVEVQEAGGAVRLRVDEPVTIEVFGLGDVEE